MGKEGVNREPLFAICQPPLLLFMLLFSRRFPQISPYINSNSYSNTNNIPSNANNSNNKIK